MDEVKKNTLIKIRRLKTIAKLKDLQKISEDDPEIAHIYADDILCNFLKVLGYADIVIEYKKIEKWFS